MFGAAAARLVEAFALPSQNPAVPPGESPEPAVVPRISRSKTVVFAAVDSDKQSAVVGAGSMPPSLVDYVRQGSTRKGGSSPSSAPRSPIDEDRSYNGSDWGNENGCHGSDPRDSYIGQELSWLPGCQRMGASSPRTSSSRQEVDDTEVDAALTALDMESNSMFAPTGSTAAKTKLRRRASLGTSLKKAQRDQENVQEELPMDTETFVKDIKERAKKENQAVESELAYALSHLNGTLIFSPHHWARQLWDWLVVLSVFMTIMLVPVALGFADRIDSITTLATLAGLDGIWWVDIIVSLRTAITHEGDFGRESLITRPGDIAWAYFRTHFALDLLAALPYFAMHISAERGLDFNHLATNASSGTLLILTIASVVPIPMALLRLQRIVRVKHVKDRLLPNTGSAQLTRIGVGIVYLLHVLGCIYWFVSVVELKRALRAEGSVTVWDGKFSPPLLYASYLPEGQQALLAINATDQLATGLTTPVTHGVGSSYLCAFVWATLGLTALEVERPSNTQQVETRAHTRNACLNANVVPTPTIGADERPRTNRTNITPDVTRYLSCHSRARTLTLPLPPAQSSECAHHSRGMLLLPHQRRPDRFRFRWQAPALSHRAWTHARSPFPSPFLCSSPPSPRHYVQLPLPLPCTPPLRPSPSPLPSSTSCAVATPRCHDGRVRSLPGEWQCLLQRTMPAAWRWPNARLSKPTSSMRASHASCASASMSFMISAGGSPRYC